VAGEGAKLEVGDRKRVRESVPVRELCEENSERGSLWFRKGLEPRGKQLLTPCESMKASARAERFKTCWQYCS
jgi:hypothetical protein